MHEDGGSDKNCVVARQGVQNLRRRLGQRSKTTRQQGSRKLLDDGDEADKNAVNQLDLIVGIFVCVGQKEIREVTRHLGAPIARTLRDGVVDLMNECGRRTHNSKNHILWSAQIGHRPAR